MEKGRGAPMAAPEMEGGLGSGKQAGGMAALKDKSLAEIGAMLEEMERSGGFDTSVLDRVAGLKSMVKDAESEWMRFEGRDGFYFYQVAKNVEFVLTQMERRLAVRRDAGGDAGIASDSLALLPTIDRALEIMRSHNTDPGAISMALDTTNDLIDKSTDVGLDTPLAEVQKGIDMDEWGRNITAIMKNLGIEK